MLNKSMSFTLPHHFWPTVVIHFLKNMLQDHKVELSPSVKENLLRFLSLVPILYNCF